MKKTRIRRICDDRFLIVICQDKESQDKIDNYFRTKRFKKLRPNSLRGFKASNYLIELGYFDKDTTNYISAFH